MLGTPSAATHVPAEQFATPSLAQVHHLARLVGVRKPQHSHLARREISATLRELLTRVPDIRSAGEPDRLLSSFINGIKHLPCEFG